MDAQTGVSAKTLEVSPLDRVMVFAVSVTADLPCGVATSQSTSASDCAPMTIAISIAINISMAILLPRDLPTLTVTASRTREGG